MNSGYAIGLDLGGTDLKAALVRPDGAVERFFKRPSGARESAEATEGAIEAAYRELAHSCDGDVSGVGLGVPGVVDPETGALIGFTPNLPHWADHPVRDWLSGRLETPVEVDNDANLAALAEHRCGAARGARVSITVTVGTGVGCGIIVDGLILRGASGGAGEIGHLPLGDGSLTCGCGIEGCVEPEMCASGLLRRAASQGRDLSDGKEVFAAAATGDAEAGRWIERMADRLGAAIATAINLINPDVVVVAGGVARAGEILLDPVRAAINRYALESHRRGLRVIPAALGERAGVVGAGLVAWQARAATQLEL